MKLNILLFVYLVFHLSCNSLHHDRDQHPNFIIIFTDDQRGSAIGYANPNLHTPNLDELASHGKIFENAFVTLSICSPSRAALLTGRYGSANGVTTFGKVSLNPGETTFANHLKKLGYQTAIVGKWHLKSSPDECGFDYANYFFSNGPWYDRTVIDNGTEKVARGFIEKYIVDRSIAYIDSFAKKDLPFLLFHCTQVPHLDNKFKWDVQNSTIMNYYNDDHLEPPVNWEDDLTGKPGYLDSGRHRQKAICYGYRDRDTLLNETKRYYAAITEMDRELGRLFDYLKEQKLADNTYIIFMGDNGWFLGEHLFTSKVLPYEESIHVPLFIIGPGVVPGINQELVLNIDIFPTIMDLLDQEIPQKIHGRSLLPLLHGEDNIWNRDHFLYEAPKPQLGSWPLWAVRSKKWKYIETYHINNKDSLAFRELYDLANDPHELNNLAHDQNNDDLMKFFSIEIIKHKEKYQSKQSIM